MVNRMVFNNLGQRPVRTALSVLAVAIEVVLIISVVGLVQGLLEDGARRQQGLGADIIIQPAGASVMMGLGSGVMPVRIGDRLRQVPGVAAVTPVLVQNFGGLTLAYGIDPSSFAAVTGGFQVLEGRSLRDGLEMVVDSVYAQDNGARVGQKRVLWNRDFEVVGIVEHGKGARVYVPLAIMQPLLGSEGKASVFYAKLVEQKWMGPVLAAFKGLLPGYPIRSMREFTSLMISGNISGVKPFQRVMITIAVLIGFLVIFLAMYTTVLERTREIGILKALGASKAYIVGIFLRETALVTIAGILVGMLGSLVLRWGVLRAFPTLTILITPAWLWRAAAIAVVGALLGAAYPALRAARQDPIEALAYE